MTWWKKYYTKKEIYDLKKNNIKDIPKDQCSLCFKTMVQPVKMNCGYNHYFCKNCVMDKIMPLGFCFNCRNEIDSNFQPNIDVGY